MAHVHALAAVLVGGHVGNDLGHDVAGHLETLGGLDELAVHHGAVVQHIPDIDETAVEDGLHEIIRVVKVQHALVMGLGDLLRQQDAPGQVPGHLAGDVVPLGGCDDGVLVAVLLGQLLIGVVEQAENALIGGVLPPDQGPVIAVNDIALGQGVLVQGHEPGLHHILNVLHQQTAAATALYTAGDFLNLFLGNPVLLVHRGVGLADGGDDLAAVKSNNRSIPFDYLHIFYLPEKGPSALANACTFHAYRHNILVTVRVILYHMALGLQEQNHYILCHISNGNYILCFPAEFRPGIPPYWGQVSITPQYLQPQEKQSPPACRTHRSPLGRNGTKRTPAPALGFIWRRTNTTKLQHPKPDAGAIL